MTAHQAYHHESILSRSIHFDPFRPSGWGWSTKRPQREQILPKGLTLEKIKYAFWIIMIFPASKGHAKIKNLMTHDIVTWSSLHLCSVVTGDNLSKAFFLSKAMIDAAFCVLGSEELNQQIEKLGFANVPNLDLPPCAARQCKAPVFYCSNFFKSFIFPSLNATFNIELVHLHIIPQETFVPGPELVVFPARATQAALAHSLHLLPFLPFVSFQIWLFQVWSNK